MGAAVLILTPQKKIPGISSWGSKTIQIFILHLIIIAILKKTQFYVWGKGLPENIAMLIMLFSSIFITCVTATKVFSYPFDWIMKSKFKNILKKEYIIEK